MNQLRKTGRVLLTTFYAVLAVAVIGTLVPGGWQFKDVATGSMRPAINPGALVVVHPVAPSSLRVGDVVTYRSPAHPSITITHRIVMATTKAGVPYFITKGDANTTPDPEIVGGQVVGRVLINIPWLGYLFAGTHSIWGVILLVVVPGLLVILYELQLMARRLGELDDAEVLEPQLATASHRAPPSLEPPARRPPRSLDGMRRLMVLVLLTGIVGVSVGATRARLSASVTLSGNTIATIRTTPSPTPSCHTASSSHVTIINQSTQTATSGAVTTSGNSTVGPASGSGSASNSNANSTTVTIANGSCT